MDSNRYWFKPKRWGYGATPITWEGWAVASAYCAVVGIASVLLVVVRESWTLSLSAVVVMWAVWGAVFVVATGALVMVGKRRTEGEWRWRWGRRANERFGVR